MDAGYQTLEDRRNNPPGVKPLGGRRKWHIGGGNEMRLAPSNGIMETTTALCGKIVANEYLETPDNLADEDDKEALFCHRCLDKWNAANW